MAELTAHRVLLYRMRRGLSLFTAVGLLFLVAFVGWQRWGPLSAASALSDFGPSPAFMLTDHLGRTVQSDNLRGQVVVANFIYTHCQDTCPLLSVRMQALQERLRTEGFLGERVQLLSFAVDPARDTVPVLRDYAARHQADPAAWRFLTGTEAVMRSVVEDGFKLGLVQVPLGEPQDDGHPDHDHGEPYDVMHSNRFALVDTRGQIRAYYDGLEVPFDRVLADIRSLLH